VAASSSKPFGCSTTIQSCLISGRGVRQPAEGAVDLFVLAYDLAVLVDDRSLLRRPITVESGQAAGTLRRWQASYVTSSCGSPRPRNRTPKAERPGWGASRPGRWRLLGRS